MDDFAPEERNLARTPAVGARREEADEAALAGELPVTAERLDADIVHVHAAVDEAAFVRLGDDERRGLREKGAHLRGDGGTIRSAADDARLTVGEDAETGFRNRLERAFAFGIEAIVASAEEREVVVAQPFQEGDALA